MTEDVTDEIEAEWTDDCRLLVGVKLSEVYAAAVSTVQDENPQLVDRMTKSAGFVMLYVYVFASNIVFISFHLMTACISPVSGALYSESSAVQDARDWDVDGRDL